MAAPDEPGVASLRMIRVRTSRGVVRHFRREMWGGFAIVLLVVGFVAIVWSTQKPPPWQRPIDVFAVAVPVAMIAGAVGLFIHAARQRAQWSRRLPSTIEHMWIVHTKPGETSLTIGDLGVRPHDRYLKITTVPGSARSFVLTPKAGVDIRLFVRGESPRQAKGSVTGDHDNTPTLSAWIPARASAAVRVNVVGRDRLKIGGTWGLKLVILGDPEPPEFIEACVEHDGE